MSHEGSVVNPPLTKVMCPDPKGVKSAESIPIT